jgi:hypothetical protein
VTDRKPINARSLVGSHDILFVTIDTLRYDVALEALERGETPNLAAILPGGRWEPRHTPGSFTYAAHHAFFTGFLPTPAAQGPHPRLFAARFGGSESTADTTFVFDTPDIVSGLASEGYRTICIGGVGFFNKQTALSRTLPGLFDESWWTPELGVTCVQSTANQVALAVERIAAAPTDKRLFLFINVSALHQPNRHYLPGATVDTRDSQRAALAYVDSQLPPLFKTLQSRAPVLAILCSDHGTTYGDDGYTGHRLAHPAVWLVPYCETVLPHTAERADR